MPLISIPGKQPSRFANPATIEALAPPPWKPNCATSHPDAKSHQRVPALTWAGSAAEAFDHLQEIIAGDLGATVEHARKPRYLWATYRSKTWGFVDNLELLLSEADGATRIDVRSASRVGIGDRGVNKARVARIRAALAARA